MITGYDDRVNIEDIHVTNSRFNNVEKKGNLITGAKDVVLKELYINGNKVRNKIKNLWYNEMPSYQRLYPL